MIRKLRCVRIPYKHIQRATNNMMRLDPTAQWPWEQDASLRFLPVTGESGVAAQVCAAFNGRHWSDIKALNMGRADWQKHVRLLYAHEPFFNLELELPGTEGQPPVGQPVGRARAGRHRWL